ncbi:MAG: GH32 C-terminal domain-containing protein [Halioglobus sp.]
MWLDTGRDSYAGVTWSDIPQEDGRTLFMGWMSNWDYAQEVPTHPWRSAMTLPRELRLEETGHGYRVYSRPAAELKKLRDQSRSIPPARLGAGEEVVISTSFAITQSELKLEYRLLPVGSYDFGVELSNALGETYRIGYTSTDNQFYSDRTAAGDASFSDKFAGVHRTVRLEDDGSISLHLFFDSASVELFADDGANVMTDIFFPTEEFTEMRLYSRGDTVELMDGEIHSLKSIWR